MYGSRPLRLALVSLIAICLVGCEDSTTGPVIDPPGPSQPPTDPQPPQPPQPPATPSAVIPVGTPALFLSTSQDASVFNEIIGEVIEGSRQNFVQFVPETGEAVLFDSNLSVSYAQSRSRVITFDDELYVVNVSETGARLRRFDNDALLASPPDRPVPTPRQFDSLEEDCFVAMGNDIIYKVAWRRDFPGYIDGPLVRIRDFFSGGTAIEELIPSSGFSSTSPGGVLSDACQFHMDRADGVWYDVDDRFEGAGRSIYTRDQDSGAPTEVGLWSGPDASANFGFRTNLAFDQGTAYYAAIDQGAQTVDIVARAVGGGLWQLVRRVPLDGIDGEFVSHIDVDDGYVSVVVSEPSGDGHILLYSPGGSVQMIPVGAPVNQLQIMYRN